MHKSVRKAVSFQGIRRPPSSPWIGLIRALLSMLLACKQETVPPGHCQFGPPRVSSHLNWACCTSPTIVGWIQVKLYKSQSVSTVPYQTSSLVPDKSDNVFSADPATCVVKVVNRAVGLCRFSWYASRSQITDVGNP